MPTRLPEKLATAALAWAATSLAVQLFLPDRRGYRPYHGQQARSDRLPHSTATIKGVSFIMRTIKYLLDASCSRTCQSMRGC